MSELRVTTLQHEAAAASNITLASNGNVGIGTSSPAGKLSVIGSTAAAAVNFDFGNNAAQAVGDTVTLRLLTSTAFVNAPTAAPYISAIQTSASTSATDITFGTFNGSTLGERMRVDSAGRVTMPYQPAFYAMMNNTNVTGTAVIIFNNVFVNTGSVYNSSNGRFTAPVAGTYSFSANGLKRGGSGRLGFRKNGSYYGAGNSQAYHGGSVDSNFAASIIITLAINDYIEVFVSNDAGDFYGNSNSHNGFSGYLIG